MAPCRPGGCLCFRQGWSSMAASQDQGFIPSLRHRRRRSPSAYVSAGYLCSCWRNPSAVTAGFEGKFGGEILTFAMLCMLCSMDCHSGSGLPDIDQLRLRNAVWPPRHPLINKATSEDPSQILDGMHLCTTRYPALLPLLRTVLPGSYRSCPALARCSHSPKLPAMASSSHSDNEREQQGVEARR